MADHAAILFFSNNHAIWTASVLKKAGIDNKMITVPRHLSSDCGYCVRIKIEDISKAEPIIKTKGIDYDRIEALERI